MNPNDLLLIAKKMGLKDAKHSASYIVYTPEGDGMPCIFSPGSRGLDWQILEVMCHFRIWIDDLEDGSLFCAYNFTNGHKEMVKRKEKPTPEGIVEAVLALALRLSK